MRAITVTAHVNHARGVRLAALDSLVHRSMMNDSNSHSAGYAGIGTRRTCGSDLAVLDAPVTTEDSPAVRSMRPTWSALPSNRAAGALCSVDIDYVLDGRYAELHAGKRHVVRQSVTRYACAVGN
jgi:hypothetical protein